MENGLHSVRRASERGSLGRWMALGFVLGVLRISSTVDALVVYRESWDSSACGWTNRPSGAMVIRFSPTNSPDAGSLAGSLLGIDVPSPGFDVFKADDECSGGMFVGNYLMTEGQVPYSLSFDFLPDDVLPSSLIFRFRGAKDGVTNTFFTCLSDQLAQAGVWQRITVPFQFNSNAWVGGAADGFSNALMNVQWVEVQVGRRGTNEQTYMLDNFSRVDWVPQGAATNDTDADGLPDFWEEAFFDGATNGVAGVDSDGDGATDLDEYRAGTHPLNSLSYPELRIRRVGGLLGLEFLSSLGRDYLIERSIDLHQGNWVPVGDEVTGDGGYRVITDGGAPADGVYRFRVWVRPP